MSKPHLLRDNPLLRELKNVGHKDQEYSAIIHAIREINLFLLVLKDIKWEANGAARPLWTKQK